MFLVPQKIYKSLHKKYAKTKIGKMMKQANLKLNAKLPSAHKYEAKRKKARAPVRPAAAKGRRLKGRINKRKTNKKWNKR